MLTNLTQRVRAVTVRTATDDQRGGATLKRDHCNMRVQVERSWMNNCSQDFLSLFESALALDKK